MATKKPSAACQTRAKTGNDVIGPSASELPQSDLPTLRDVLAHALFLKENSNLRKIDISSKEVAKTVTAAIKAVWAKVNHQIVVPGVIILDKNIERMFMTNWEMMRKVRNKNIGKQKSEEWKLKLDKTFNILTCQCSFKSCPDSKCQGCADNIHIDCSCPAKTKFPKLEIPFLYSQLSKTGTKGGMMIASGDKVETAKQAKTLANKEKIKLQNEKKIAKENTVKKELAKRVADFQNNDQQNNSDSGNEIDDEEFRSAATDKLIKKTTQNRIKFSNLARVSLSCDVSLGATAQLATALLIDLNLVTEADTSKIVDKSKIKRERYRVMKELHQQGLNSLKEQDLTMIIFDGKRDRTKVLFEDEDGDEFPGVKEVEHYSVVDGVDGCYLTHLDPEDGTGKAVAQAMYDWIDSIGQADNISVIGADSTAVNTGWKQGAIHHMEVFLGHKLMWSICQLHLNELGLRHLIEAMDGPTGSANTFIGPVGQLLTEDVQDWVKNKNFSVIVVEEGVPVLPDDVLQDLSTDQKHGYQLVMLVTGRSQEDRCLKLKPGPVCHSRWLTTANRLLIMYCKKHGLRGNKAKTLSTLVHFIVTNYYPMWFSIKCECMLIAGPFHLLKAVKFLAIATDEVQEIVRPVIQRGSYHGHSENILLSLLCSSDAGNRKFAVSKILQLRGEDQFGDKSVRSFHVPAVNWEATSLLDLIIWEECEISEPFLTCDMSSKEIMHINKEALVVEKFSGHGQAVERAVKEVSNAASKVYGFERRDGLIRAKLKSRKLVSKPNSKKDFVGMLAS